MAAHTIIFPYGNPVIAISPITGGVKGPHIKPVSPIAWKITPTVLGVIPTAATIGIIIGAIIAFPPANVPNKATITREQIIVTTIPFFSLFTPILLTIQ